MQSEKKEGRAQNYSTEIDMGCIWPFAGADAYTSVPWYDTACGLY